MNQYEYEALSQSISNDARTLYVLGLRPSSDPITGLTRPLNYKALLALLNAKEQKFTRGRQLNGLLKELINAQLIHLSDDDNIRLSLNDKTLLLPLRRETDKAKLLPEKYPMHRDWQPNEQVLADICQLMGIIDQQYQDSELGEFIAYWLGRTETKHSDYQWMQKFAGQMKRQRLASETQISKTIGTQTSTNTVSAIEIDDNAKRLVAKYKKLKNNK